MSVQRGVHVVCLAAPWRPSMDDVDRWAQSANYDSYYSSYIHDLMFTRTHTRNHGKLLPHVPF